MKTRILFAAILVFAGYTMSQPAPTADPSPLPDRTAPPQLVADLRGAGIPSATAERYGAACLGLAELIERGSLSTCADVGSASEHLGTFASQFGSIGTARQVIERHFLQFDDTGELTSELRAKAARLYRELGTALMEVSR